MSCHASSQALRPWMCALLSSVDSVFLVFHGLVLAVVTTLGFSFSISKIIRIAHWIMMARKACLGLSSLLIKCPKYSWKYLPGSFCKLESYLRNVNSFLDVAFHYEIMWWWWLLLLFSTLYCWIQGLRRCYHASTFKGNSFFSIFDVICLTNAKKEELLNCRTCECVLGRTPHFRFLTCFYFQFSWVYYFVFLLRPWSCWWIEYDVLSDNEMYAVVWTLFPWWN